MTSRDSNAKGKPTDDVCNYNHTTTELSANTDAIDIFHSRVFSDGGHVVVVARFGTVRCTISMRFCYHTPNYCV